MPLEIYEALGFELKKSGSQLLSVCPFCGKDKFYVDPEKTTYHCKVCGAKGNDISIMKDMFSNVYREIPDERYDEIASWRGMPVEALRHDDCLGWDPYREKFVFYSEKLNGQASCIRTVNRKDGRCIIKAAKGTKLCLIGTQALAKTDKSQAVYITEGEWDRMALRFAFKKCKLTNPVIAVPGAEVFQKTWAEWLQGREVVLLMDNDEPGRKGARRTYGMLKGYAKSIKVINWPSYKKDGYDVHDLVKKHVGSPKKAVDFIHKYLKDTPPGFVDEKKEEQHARVNEQENLDPISVDELHAVFRKWLHLENCDLLDIVMGTLWSIHLDGSPLWLFIVSPPSASKSETLMPVSEWYRCFAMSNLTAKSLISGFSGQGGADPSLFSQLDSQRAALIVKDLTPILQAHPMEREEVFGILRDAYDGCATKIFGNGIKREYHNLHFALLAGVTPAIDLYDSVVMGERFLKFRADKEIDRHDDTVRAFKAITNCGRESAMKNELKEACVRSLVRKTDPASAPVPDDEFAGVVSKLATLCAKMRAVAPSDRYSDVQSMFPLQEAPPRLAVQFTKLARGLALYFESSTLLDDRIMRLLKRVVIHTPDIITTRIVRFLYDEYHNEGASLKTVGAAFRSLSRDTIKTTLIKLSRTGVCETIVPPGMEGQMLLYRLEENTYTLIKECGLFDSLPHNDPLYVKPRLTIRRKK